MAAAAVSPGAAGVMALWTRRIGLILGPLAAAAIQLAPLPAGLAPEAWLVLSLAVWMVIWWASLAIAPAATALLPLALLPLIGAGEIARIAAPYADPIVLLLAAGFFIGLAITRWGLHERLALIVASRANGRRRLLVAGFMGTAALIALFVSSATTTLMLAPIAFGAARLMSEGEEIDPMLGGALLLGVAYAAAIGAIGTPISSPLNLAAMAFLDRAGEPMSVIAWTLAALPIMLILLPLAWLLLTWRVRDGDAGERERAFVAVKARLKALGPLTKAERRLAWFFGALAFLWMFRPIIAFAPGLDTLSDAGVGMIAALALFLIPSGDEDGAALLDWRTAERAPWGILILLGGGLALANAMETSGLAQWIGEGVANLNWGTLWGLVAALVVTTIFLGEISSNQGVLVTLLPIIAGVSVATGVDLRALVFPVALASSFAFMLPVTNAPNAIAYATGLISWPRMLTIGLIMNVAAILAIVGVTRLAAAG
ncbi:MAG: DASS family sodium-coupled anion symporter [Hyphomonadaceae bacterium]